MKDEIELSAAKFVSRFEGGSNEGIVKTDTGKFSSTHDFNICVNKRCIALEVTSICDEKKKSLWSKKTEKLWKESLLSCAWLLKLKSNTNIKKFKERNFTEYLKEFERLQIKSINTKNIPYDWAKEEKKAAKSLNVCGVEYANVLEAWEPGYIKINIGGDGGWISSDSLIENVQKAINLNLRSNN